MPATVDVGDSPAPWFPALMDVVVRQCISLVLDSLTAYVQRKLKELSSSQAQERFVGMQQDVSSFRNAQCTLMMLSQRLDTIVCKLYADDLKLLECVIIAVHHQIM